MSLFYISRSRSSRKPTHQRCLRYDVLVGELDQNILGLGQVNGGRGRCLQERQDRERDDDQARHFDTVCSGARGASVSFIDQLSRVTFGSKVSVPYLYGSFVIPYLVAHHHARFSPPRNTNKGNATASGSSPCLDDEFTRMTLEKISAVFIYWYSCRNALSTLRRMGYTYREIRCLIETHA